MNAQLTHSMPPLRDPNALVSVMAKVHRSLAGDLRERSLDPRIEPSIRKAHASDIAAGRTGEGYETYREAFCDQVGASWVLCAVFARTLEDRGYVPHRLAGPGAADRFAQFVAQFKFLRERDYLLHVFDALSLLPGGAEVFGPAHAPLWRLGPSSRALGELLDALKATDGEALRFTFGRPVESATTGGAEPATLSEHDGASTRYLGDLYQDLNEGVRKRYALLQTPEFVERFILDQTLDPAIRERGIAVTVIDPACGSGHFLIGAYDRLFEARRAKEPGKPLEESARTALAQIHGVDLNPYAAAIARFRLLLSYLDKAGIQRLDKVPSGLDLRVYVGDALLAGWREEQMTFGDDLARRNEVPEHAGYERGELYSFYDTGADALLAKTRFDVVVANPPYITEKDPIKRESIRKRYDAAAGKYALSSPFAERIFKLANDGGFTGQITANSFMKREFGKGLIEKVLSAVDLTEVLDTSGAFIPGHGTPTVILFGRARAPVGSTVRVAMGNRGEPTTPEIPAEGKVWSSIAKRHGEVGYEDEFISIADVEREKLAQHPWSLGGGGAAELKELLEEKAEKRLGEVVDSIGIASFTLEDDVYMSPRHAHVTRGLAESDLRYMVEGDVIRDWSMADASSVVFPYDDKLKPLLTSSQLQYLWPWKTSLASNILFGGKTKVQGGLHWYEFGRLTANKLLTPLTITFAFVATHNHFVLDRGGKVFNRSAPIIKLPEGATEEDHLALLGYLNSSSFAFSARQACHSKGGQGINEGIKAEKWEQFLEFSGTAIAAIRVLPSRLLFPLAKELSEIALSLQRCEPGSVIKHSSAIDLRAELARTRLLHDQKYLRMVLLQEEIDWLCYRLLGLPHAADERAVAEGEGLRPQERCCELLAAEEAHESWFVRHKRSPLHSVLGAEDSGDRQRVLKERLQLVRANKNLELLEALEHKRRWEPFQWDAAVVGECEAWLADRTESELRENTTQEPVSVRGLAQSMHVDPKVHAVAEILTGTPTFDLETLLGELIERESVASATCQRYTDIGIEKRRAWERTWELQRLEDAGEHPTIPKPEKYDQKDFENAATVWRHRGKLDVPKERFIAYPTATPPPGASGKAGLVFGWAGWNHLEQLQAAIELWQEELGLHGHELIPNATRKEREESLGAAASTDPGLADDRAARERLMPILQTMVDLLPWVRQWHDEDGETASSFEAYVDAEARKLEVTREEAHLYRRPKKVAGGKKKGVTTKNPTEMAAHGEKRPKRKPASAK